MKKIYKIVLIFSLVLLPFLTFAQYGPGVLCPDGSLMDDTLCGTAPGSLASILFKIKVLLNSIIPILIGIGLVYFIWGVVRYVIADGEEAKDKGKDTMLYGVIGFAVIAGIWGLVNIVVETFNLDTAAPDLAPLVVGGEATCTISSTSKLQDVLCYARSIINDSVIPFIFAVATVFFIWGAIKFFILNADEEAQRDQGRQFMIWGIVALAVMLSVWGLVGILTSTFGIDGSVLPKVCPGGVGC